MSSTGQGVGSVVGAVVGFMIGGPKGAMYGYSIGSMLGTYIDPPKGPTAYGPRLEDLSVQTSTAGAFIPRIYGTSQVIGNIFWLENNRLKETRKKTKLGGKGGGSSITYSYSATFAVGLCEGPILGVQRIWIGQKLVYDASASSLEAILASNQASNLFTVYKGNSTQAADPRMQATLGVANTPAYRGLAYIVFKDYPLTGHGNSLLGAQVKVEVINSLSTSTVSSVISSTFYQPHGNTSFPPQPYFMSVEKVIFYIPQWESNYPPSSQYNKMTVTLADAFDSGYVPLGSTGVPSNGRLYNETDCTTPSQYSGTYPFTSVNALMTGPSGQVFKYKDFWVGISSYITNTVYVKGIINGYTIPEKSLNLGTTPLAVAVDDDYIYIVGYAASYKLTHDLTKVVAIGVGTYLSVNTGDSRACLDNGVLYYCHNPGSNVANVNILKFADNLSSYSTFASGLTGVASYYAANLLVKDNIVVIAGGHAGTKQLSVRRYALGKVNPDLVTLSSIVQAECLKSNLLTASDIDVTQLTQTVRGFRISSLGSIRAPFEQVQAVYPFDPVQSGYQIKFYRRGKTSVATIPASDLGAIQVANTSAVSITNIREMDSVLPKRVNVTYFDVEREYDVGEQYAERLNTDAINVKTLELPICLNATEAAAAAETLLYMYWLERYDISFTLPPTYRHLEPADVITINATEATYEVRLTSINYLADGRLECTGKYNSTAIYTPTAVGESGQSTGQTLGLSGPTDMLQLNIPNVLDTLTNEPGYHLAMSGYYTSWPGATLFTTTDSGQTWNPVQGVSAPGVMMGIASNTIGAGAVNMFDYINRLTVNFTSGSMVTVTDESLFNGANHFAYGANGRWEIIAARSRYVAADGSYTLYDLLRGRFGTEANMTNHAAGDRVIALDPNNFYFVSVLSNDINTAKTFRAVTNDAYIDDAADISFTYTGINLECLSPVHVTGNRNNPSANDWTITWVRRTRVGAEWRDGVDASLGETTESYEVEIYTSSAFTTLKRTITGLTTASATYTSAQQVTDFGSNQATIYLKIYQLSSVVGRGFPATITLTR